MKSAHKISIISLTILTLLWSSIVTGQSNGEQEDPSQPVSLDPSSLNVLGTGFTYQGRLEDTGGVVDGNCDFAFSLWNAASGGAQIGSTQTLSGIPVTSGVFTVVINGSNQFGSTAFDGNSRWLRIEVRCPSGSGSFTTLSPRQELTPVPYAMYAEDDDWVFSSGSGPSGIIYHTGDVALGTITDPESHGLSVQNYVVGKGAVRGLDQSGTDIYAEGMLGVLATTAPNPLNLPIAVTNAGVLGIKPNLGGNGAAVYGWNNDSNATNYAGLFVADGVSTGSNYGIYADASGASNNVAGYFGNRVGIRMTAPGSDVHIKQTNDFIGSGNGGITYESATAANRWRTYHSAIHFSFDENGIRRAYVEGGSGNWVQPSDRSLKQDIQPLGNILHNVMQLDAVSYRYAQGPGSSPRTYGFVAQDVEAIFPDLVKTGEAGEKGLAYSEFGVLAIAAIQEQQALIDSLQLQVDQLRTEVDEFKAQIDNSSSQIAPQGEDGFSITAINGGDTSLEVGDLVAASGVTSSHPGASEPLLIVESAGARPALQIVGVVQAVDSADSTIAPGDLMTVRVQGLAQVNVSATSTPIQVGDRLFAAPASSVVSVQSDTNDSELSSIEIGVALESLAGGSGLIWVLVGVH